MVNFLILVGLLILGGICCFFGVWAYRIGIAMRTNLVGNELKGVTSRMRTLSEWLKICVVTLPFAFVAFQTLCKLEDARHRGQARPVANEVFWLVGLLFLSALALFVATAIMMLNRGAA